LCRHGFKPKVFIPPFNTFDFQSLDVLRKYFRVVTGGPESINLVGFRLSPSILGGILYVPSYEFAYGRASEILDFVRKVKDKRFRNHPPDATLGLGGG